jgi:hypothetical protein
VLALLAWSGNLTPASRAQECPTLAGEWKITFPGGDDRVYAIEVIEWMQKEKLFSP